MKKVSIVLLILSIIIIILGIIIGLGTSNEILNSVSLENNTNVNVATSGIGADYSDIIQIFGVFSAKVIGTMIIVCSIVIDLLIWLFYGLILLFIRIIKKIKNNKIQAK